MAKAAGPEREARRAAKRLSRGRKPLKGPNEIQEKKAEAARGPKARAASEVVLRDKMNDRL